jgi:hypothetical protein
MATERATTLPMGSRIFGLGIAALGLACLVFGDLDPGQTVPKNFPARTALAYCAGALMFASGHALEWRRTAAWGSAILTSYYTAFVLLLMNGRLLIKGYAVYGTYENIAMQLAIAACGLIIYAMTAQIRIGLATRLKQFGRTAFGICSMIWRGAHFVYMDMTAPLVPKWLPPGQVFWGYLTGVCFIAAGLAVVTGIQARLAALLLTVMIRAFGLLANSPMLVSTPSSKFNWTESLLNLALTGAAWVVTDSLARSSPNPASL